MTDDSGHISKITDDMGHSFRIYSNRYLLDRRASYRAICSYVARKDSTADIRALSIIDCPNALDTSCVNREYHIYDPLGIESAYIGGGYLNVILKIRTRNEDSFRQHLLIPVRFSSPDSLVFSFIHNDSGDMPVYTKKLYCCIPLADYGLQKNDAVFLKYRNYNEEDCCLKYIYR